MLQVANSAQGWQGKVGASEVSPDHLVGEAGWQDQSAGIFVFFLFIAQGWQVLAYHLLVGDVAQIVGLLEG